MSSLRPEKVAAAVARVIGELFAKAPTPDGPPCSCSSCEEAWRRNQPAAVRQRVDSRRKMGLG